MIYVAAVAGWMTLINAPDERQALVIAQDRAEGASLLRSDINESHIRAATQDDINWFGGMATVDVRKSRHVD